MLTSSSLFLHTLTQLGITHAFVNWGSDHPALLEDLERQRQESKGEPGLKVVTCPNEMVALSAAQGYAQVAGRPAAVIVHVDVGTQALAGAVHNVNRSRTPVLIYAGASPFSMNGEHKGTRNEWIMWIQDIPDQTAIVRQYMRYTAQLNSAKTVPQVVKRAMQIATSDPKGPVYLWARRETMEEEIPSSLLSSTSTLHSWPSIEPTGLSPKSLVKISTALLQSTHPLILTAHLGRTPSSVSKLITLSKMLAIPIVPVCPSTVNAPISHPFTFPPTFLFPNSHSPFLSQADVILVLECDLPWIPANEKPKEGTKVFVIDAGDPLKVSAVGMGTWAIEEAEMVCSAEAGVALGQIVDEVQKLDADSPRSILHGPKIKARRQKLCAEHQAWLDSLDAIEAASEEGVYTVPQITAAMRNAICEGTKSKGEKALVLNETISNYVPVWTHLLPELPGSVISSGGSSLGWGLGAAVGASLTRAHEFVALIVGDGSFLFGVPSSAYWMARKYDTPFLTVILNNSGWRSPKLSMSAVHPTGLGIKQSGEMLTVGFGPHNPDYVKIAEGASAGWAWGEKVQGGDREKLENAMREAVRVVVEEGRCAVVDCVVESI